MTAIARLAIFQLDNTLIFQTAAAEVRSGTAWASLAITDAMAETLAAQIKAAVEALNDRLAQRPHPVTTPAPADPLLGLGRLLYQEFLPPVIQQFLSQTPPTTPLLLTTQDTLLPWELAHDGAEYLCLRHIVARQQLLASEPRHTEPRHRKNWTALIIGAPGDDLVGIDDEVQRLVQLIEARPGAAARVLMRRRATREAVRQELAAGDYDLVHFSGHAVAREGDPASNALLLGGGTVLTAREIEQVLGGQPFVFLNACASADTRAARPLTTLTDLNPAVQGLATAFILGGASGVVGTFWPIRDADASQLPVAFYRAALRGQPVGAALQQVRLAAWQADPLDPRWASFALYGDPTRVLLTPDSLSHQPASVMVVRLASTKASARGQAGEATAQRQQAALIGVSDCLATFGGQVQGLVDDTLIATFGVPLTQQNDAECAVRAALDLLQSDPPTDRPTPQEVEPPCVSVGISSGEVYLSRVGGEPDAPLAVLGEGVTQATALARAAPPGAALVSESVHRLTHHLFELGRWSSPGASPALEPVAYQVLKARPPSTPAEVGRARQTALVGREAEIAYLQQAWQACQRGQGQVIGIVGDAGVGKSRLLAEFQALVGEQAARCLVVNCPSAYRPGPYWLLSHLLIGLLNLNLTDQPDPLEGQLRQALLPILGDESDAGVTESVGLLAYALGLPLGHPLVEHLEPRGRQRRLVQLTARLLAHATVSEPLILALDDLQWADEASLEVVAQTTLRLERHRLLVVALFRPDVPPALDWWQRQPTRLIRLAALDDIASQALLAALLGEPETMGAFAPLILQHTGGNPLFIREWITALQEAGALARQGQHWHLTRPATDIQPPATLQRLILMRAATLPEPARRLLPLVAVASDRVTPAWLRQVLADTDDNAILDDGLAQLERRAFLQCDWDADVYQFTHALIREVVYASLPPDERRRLHRRLGQALERQSPSHEGETMDRLAHHYHHSDDRVRAVQYDLRAARRAADAWANTTALEWFDRALSILDSWQTDPPTPIEVERGATPEQRRAWRVEVLEGAADVQALIGQGEPALARYQQALDLSADAAPARRAELYRKLAIVLHNRGDLDAAQAALEAGLHSLDGQECLEAGRLYLWLGMLHQRAARLGEALEACERGIALIAPRQSTPDLAQAYNLQGVIFGKRGDNGRAIHAHEQSIALYKLDGYLPGLERATHNLGCVYDNLSRWADALRCFEESAALSALTGEERRRAAAQLSLGEIRRGQGELDQAIAAYQSALAAAQESGFVDVAGMAWVNLGACYLEQEQVDAARAALDKGQAEFQRAGLQSYQPEVLRLRAELELLAGDLDLAGQLASEALAQATSSDQRLEMGRARRTLGKLERGRGRLEAAQARLDESLTLLSKLGSPADVARTQVELARLRLAQAALAEDPAPLRAQARVDLAAALQTFETLGARLEADRARALQRQLA